MATGDYLQTGGCIVRRWYRHSRNVAPSNSDLNHNKPFCRIGSRDFCRKHVSKTFNLGFVWSRGGGGFVGRAESQGRFGGSAVFAVPSTLSPSLVLPPCAMACARHPQVVTHRLPRLNQEEAGAVVFLGHDPKGNNCDDIAANPEVCTTAWSSLSHPRHFRRRFLFSLAKLEYDVLHHPTFQLLAVTSTLSLLPWRHRRSRAEYASSWFSATPLFISCSSWSCWATPSRPGYRRRPSRCGGRSGRPTYLPWRGSWW